MRNGPTALIFRKMVTAVPPNQPSGAGPPDPDDTPVLPVRSEEDTDIGWGEQPEPDDDDRLRHDRPPHWASA
jgi:hypothetical protein